MANRVSIDDKTLEVALEDGRLLSTPLSFYPWLQALTAEERMQVEIIGDGSGIWWRVPDQGLSVPALFGQNCE